MKNCELLDRYRDGELNDSQKEEFRRHLAVCRECRTANALLDNLVSVMRDETITMSDMADKIARRAFQRISSWDGLLAQWFRPGLAFATACLSIALCAFIWFAPERPPDDSMEYETLLNQADASDPASEILTAGESDFVLMLMWGGNTQ
ncbi:MAG: zf-HC2 domain-containing protein [Acidobacteriota bacterium]|jgi:hypothetical protein|nr:zf-HC2 domain-containing protein [Acidobacteriota bacterium]